MEIDYPDHFGDEYIVGGFILKTIFFTSNHKFFKQNYNWIIYIIISYIIVILLAKECQLFYLVFLYFFVFIR